MDFEDVDSLLLAMSNDVEQMVSAIGDAYVGVVQEYVQEYVYNPYTPRIYDRTHEFYDSWTYKQQRSGLSINGEIFSDPDKMSFDPENFIHGSGGLYPFAPMAYQDFGAVDRRSIMAQIVAEGTNFDFYIPEEKADKGDNWWARPRDYWTPSIGEIDGTINSMIKIQSKKFNLDLI